MHVVIFTGGELHQGLAVTKALSQFDKVIAADSGAATAVSLKITPDLVIGDFDSMMRRPFRFSRKEKLNLSAFRKKKTRLILN